MVNVDPFIVPIPKALREDDETRRFFEQLVRTIYDLRERTGGGNDLIAQIEVGELSDNGIESVGEEVEDSTQVLSDLYDKVDDIDYAPILSDMDSRIDDIEDHLGPILITDDTEIVETSADYTTSGTQVVLCTNSNAITVTLNATPDDGESVEIKRFNALVTISGTVDGSSTLGLCTRYDAVRLRYFDSQSSWGIM